MTPLNDMFITQSDILTVSIKHGKVEPPPDDGWISFEDDGDLGITSETWLTQ